MTPDTQAHTTAHKQRQQRLRRTWRYLSMALATCGAVVFFLFITASGNNAFFERHYSLLLWVNVGVLVGMFFSVMFLALRLWQRKRNGKFGARLMARLALWFALIGVLPGIVIYAVSVQFLAKSLESWFNVKVDSALEAGLNLGRAALDKAKLDLLAQAQSVALDLSDTALGGQAILLSRTREQSQLSEAVLFNHQNRVLVTVGNSITLVPHLPDSTELARVRVSGGVVVLEGDALNSIEGPLRVRVVVPVSAPLTGTFGGHEELFLQLVQPIEPALARNAQAVEVVHQEYRQLALGRKGLQQIYGITLTMTLLLAAFAAMVGALLLAQGFSKPLLALAEGTLNVASGDFRPLPIIKTGDEIAGLTASFNRMTQQLADARDNLLTREAELERTNHYLNNVLTNISAGVLVFDQHYQLRVANDAAAQILQLPLTDYAGASLEEIPGLQQLAEGMRTEFAALHGEQQTWQRQFELEASTEVSALEGLILLARGSRLEWLGGRGYIVVFDDISALISGQRAVAWSEVARRLAHEIKNPLTPIQLSAERLEKKLAAKLSAEDAQMLQKSVTTIVTQVEAMKCMVNEFRDYARMPPAELKAVDLNTLIEETAALYGDGDLYQLELTRPLPLVEGDATHLRQVIHNLMLNAQDAVKSARSESGGGIQNGDVVLRTKTLEYDPTQTTRHLAVCLEVQDKGTGFSSKILTRAFEPYVTTKPRGTGLGLAIVRKIVDEHKARITLANVETGGALVSIIFTRLTP